jgi:hypothetical protein
LGREDATEANTSPQCIRGSCDRFSESDRSLLHPIARCQGDRERYPGSCGVAGPAESFEAQDQMPTCVNVGWSDSKCATKGIHGLFEFPYPKQRDTNASIEISAMSVDGESLPEAAQRPQPFALVQPRIADATVAVWVLGGELRDPLVRREGLLPSALCAAYVAQAQVSGSTVSVQIQA